MKKRTIFIILLVAIIVAGIVYYFMSQSNTGPAGVIDVDKGKLDY